MQQSDRLTDNRNKVNMYNRCSSCSLTNTGVPPEDVPVEDVEGEVSEATWDLAVEVLPIEGTRDEKTQGKLKYTYCTHLRVFPQTQM